MFKFAILIAVVAVSVSWAVSVPDIHEPSAASSIVIAHKNQYPLPGTKGPQQIGQAGGVKASPGNLSNVFSVFGLPKKIVGAVTGAVAGLLKSLGGYNLLKAAKLAALVATLSTLITVSTVAVAGLVSVVSAICGFVLYVKYLLGVGNGNNGGVYDSHIENVSDFVNNAFVRYGHYDA